MFHNSTTIWHNKPLQGYGIKEKRLINVGFLDKLKTGLGSGWSVIKAVTLPVRLPFKPITIPLWWGGGKIIDALKGVQTPIQKYKHKASVAAGTVKHMGIGAAKTVAYPTYELMQGPYEDLRINLVENFRTITKGIFTMGLGVLKMPINIIKAPFRFLEGVWETISNTRNRISNLFSGTKNVAARATEMILNPLSINPKEIAKSTRSTIGSILKSPITVPLAIAKGIVSSPMLEKPLRPFIEPFQPVYQVGKNIVNSKLQYLAALNNAKNSFKENIVEILPSNAKKKAEAEVAAKEGLKMDEKKGDDAKVLPFKPKKKKKDKEKEAEEEAAAAELAAA